MHNRIYTYIKNSNLLYNSDFKVFNSTDHFILQLANDISNALDKKEFTLGVFIDLSIYFFDTLNHKIIFKKLLKYYGIKYIFYTWFKSYLHKRKQFRSYNNNKSISQFGVSQGSIFII